MSLDCLIAMVQDFLRLGTPFDKLERVYGLVKHPWQGKAFVYLTAYKDCPLPYAEFPDIEKVSSGNAAV